MQFAAIPDAQSLAALVSSVTETMCGISFAAAESREKDPAMLWRIASLPITGVRPIRVVLSSDQHSCQVLGAALFSCPADQVDATMIDDSLCELLNMAAGQIKSALGLDQALGLPKIMTRESLGADIRCAMDRGVVLGSVGQVHLLIWICDET